MTNCFYGFVGSVKIDKPCLNIVGMLHPKTACSFLDGERGDCNDGMWARFHFCTQAPVFPRKMVEIQTSHGNIPSLERCKHYVYDIVYIMNVFNYYHLVFTYFILA